VGLDEAHASHVGRQVVHFPAVGDRLIASCAVAEVELPIIDVREKLVPLSERLEINGSQIRIASAPKVRDKVSTDESSRTCHKYHALPLRLGHDASPQFEQ
jgi:hypothetical protein